MGEEQNNQELLQSLLYLLLSEKVSAEDLKPALQSFTRDSIEVDEILRLLKTRPEERFQSLAHIIEDKRLNDAGKFYYQNQEGCLDESYFRENLKGLPLHIPKNNSDEGVFSELNEACDLLNDYFYLLKKQQVLPEIFASVEKKCLSKIDLFSQHRDFLSILNAEKLVENSWHRVNDELRSEFRQFKQELKKSYETSFDESARALAQAKVPLKVKHRDALLAALEDLVSQQDEVPDFLLFLIFQWPDLAVVRIIRKLWEKEADRDQLVLLLIMRFGQLSIYKVANWSLTLDKIEGAYLSSRDRINHLSKQYPISLLYMWCMDHGEMSESLFNHLKESCFEEAQKTNKELFLERWQDEISENERNKILGITKLSAQAISPEEKPSLVLTATQVTTQIVKAPILGSEKVLPVSEEREDKSLAPVASLVSRDEAPTVSRAPRVKSNKHSIWQEHMKPFINDNWFMIAGLMLFIGGSSILSYFTWDKHWVFRYTLMPSLLASFTLGLAYLGKWIESKGKEFVSSATILRGAAIQLLPINFMAVALMSSDDIVSHKNLIIPLMSSIYLGLTWLGLKKWCGAVSKQLTVLLPRTLLVINSLVVLAPLAEMIGLKKEDGLLVILGCGFYFGFALVAYSFYSFSRGIKEIKGAVDKRIIWFFTLMVVGSFLQVFLWVHSHIRTIPEIYTYAPLLVISGGLVLMLERSSAEFIKLKKSQQDDESFIGYALIVIALVMGFADPNFRVICLLLAAFTWYLQSLKRARNVHYYITLSLLSSGIFAISGLSFFDTQYMPVLGIINVIILAGLNYKFRQAKNYSLAHACTSTQLVVLLAIVLLAMVNQLQFKSSLILTTLYLVFSALMFIYRSYRDEQIKWLHIGMFIFALCLPYGGCVDMLQGTLRGNTLIFGLALLSILWLLVVRFIPFSLFKEARSTVLWFYGCLAVVTMIIRVFLERNVAVDPEWYKAFMDYSGPLLMTGILILTSYYSRSLIPALMASIIAVILFPELKANFRATFDTLGFGSGLGSACSAFVMIGLSFYLRRSPKLKDLAEGDKFMMTSYFPMRRYDHSLFTLPLICSASFLLIKTASFNLIRQMMSRPGISIKAAIALIICSLSAYALYLYFRKTKLKFLFHLAWIYLGIGIFLLFIESDPHVQWGEPYLCTLISLQALYFLAYSSKKNYDFLELLFVQPMSQVLAALSHVASLLLILTFMSDSADTSTPYLVLFVIGQFLWHLKSKQKIHYGISLYLLIWAQLSDWSADTINELIMPGVYLALSTLVIHAVCSRLNAYYDSYKALFKSFLLMASLSSVLFAIFSLPYLAQDLHLSSGFMTLSILVLILAYLENQSKFLLLLAFSSLYSYIHYDQLDDLLNVTHLSLAALVMSVMSYGLVALEKAKETWMETGKALVLFKSRDSTLLYLPAIFLCIFAALLHLIYWRKSSEYLVSTYIAFLALCFISWAWKKAEVRIIALISLSLANIHLIVCFGEAYLIQEGLSELHLWCLGLGLTLIMSAAYRRFTKDDTIKSLLAHGGLVLSILVLVLLVGNYISHPNLDSVSPLRFFVSGLMALLASLYFRSASRKPQDGEEKYADIFEGIYHFGLSMSFWCFTLMIPFMRSPQTAILAFGLPAIYFYYMAELYYARGEAHKIYRNSSSLLLYVLLLLYLFKGIVHMTFYPEVAMDNSYYHSNAPILIVYGLLLFRMHALGAKIQSAFYGGLAMVFGVFFSLSAIPSLSPFDYPIKASFLAVINAHIWILINHQKSPIRSFFMDFSKINEDQWFSLRKNWGVCLLFLTQVLGLIALVNTQYEPYMFAPVLFLSASVAVHLCIIRKSKFYGLLALLELVFAMHAGFLMESYIKADDVIWLILGLWVIFTFINLYKYNNIPSRRSWSIAAFFIILLIPQIVYHELYTLKSLCALILMIPLSLFTAYPREIVKNPIERFLAFAYLCLPAYLAYFITYDESLFVHTLYQQDALPASLFAIFMTLLALRQLDKCPPKLIESFLGLRYKVLNLVYSWWKQKALVLTRNISFVVSGGCSLLLIIYMNEAFSRGQFMVLLFTFVGMTIIWFWDGRKNRSQVAYYMMAYSVLILMAFLRHQLVSATSLWRDEYDIWSSLLVSLLVAGVKPLIDDDQKEMRKPLLGLLLLMPIIALSKSIYYDLGSQYTLMIIGVNSLIFSFLGKDDRESPYHLISMLGYVAFSSMTLWTQLGLRTLHVYVIPAGVGVLIVLQLMKNSISLERRNLIRLITLLLMVSTSLYYALVDQPHSLGFNLTVIILSLLAMAFGSLYKIRLYVILGFLGLFIDLCSIFTRMLISLEKGTRMAILGSCILIIGSLLVFANLYYKTHQETIKNILDKWRSKLKSWE
ncbi:hypothetical protein PQO03_05215 [Lentisphaera profundi]|uniref:DUF2157 domain-containing protein n=1 Tax=Lentisphaera profundi TaxID=1658616 RepID=A0ABY7VT29_9BACT|nr:hypothetical protein [Lentisphaera profundi]WDE97350.1 hypothetical protein PQO03_05215 [Lentisphaera profundi]